MAQCDDAIVLEPRTASWREAVVVTAMDGRIQTNAHAKMFEGLHLLNYFV